LGQASQRSRSIDYRRSLRLSLNCLSKRERRLRLPFSFGCKITKTPKGCNHSGLLTIRMSEHRMTAKSIIPKDFYVYLHRKGTTKDVFYVGKGYGKRAWVDSNRGSFWLRVLKKHGIVVEIVEQGLQEWYAFELEKDLISFYGRKDLGFGSLINMTDGGDGVSGRKMKEDAKKKISNARFGKKLSKEHKEKLSIAKIGKAKPQAVRNKTSVTKRKKSKKIICVDNGLIFEAGICAQRWLQENGEKVGARSAIYACCKGQRPSAYGYTWKYA
jgi:hypothetical protein